MFRRLKETRAIMGCFWKHDWNKWSDPIQRVLQYMLGSEKIGTGVEHSQRRTCNKCGKTQTRKV